MSEYCTNLANCVDYTKIKTGSEVALIDAVYRVGPISIGVDATNYHFQFYSDGVYAEKSCNSHSLNHGMLLVGYGVTYDGMEYWIVKNRYMHEITLYTPTKTKCCHYRERDIHCEKMSCNDIA